MLPEIEKLIEMALADGQVTEKEREIILRKAEKLNLDVGYANENWYYNINCVSRKNNGVLKPHYFFV